MGLGPEGESRSRIHIRHTDLADASVAGCAISYSGHALALRDDGSLWVWGANAAGQLGLGTTVARPTPQRVPGDWISAAGGAAYSLGVKADGTLWAWGSNSSGELGDGTTVAKTAPVRIGTAVDWERVFAAGSSSYALKSDGTLWAWGGNAAGQIGDGSKANRLTPYRVSPDTDWDVVSLGTGFVLVSKTGGSLWGWGANNTGQLGRGDTVEVLLPTRVGVDSDWRWLATGASHTIAVKDDESLWAWGTALYGALGNGVGSSSSASPLRIPHARAVRTFCAQDSSFALDANGGLSAWGYGRDGELADMTTGADRTIPVTAGWDPYSSVFVHAIPETSGTYDVITAFRDDAGNVTRFSSAITLDPDGDPGTFVLEEGASVATRTALSVENEVPGAVNMRLGQRAVDVRTSGGLSTILLEDGPVLLSGYLQTPGNLTPITGGDFATYSQYLLHFQQLVAADRGWTQMAQSAGGGILALDRDGMAWGFGGGSGLGLGDGKGRKEWTLLNAYPNHRIEAGSVSVLIREDGTPDGAGPRFTTGANDSGQLGQGYTSASPSYIWSPVPVGGSSWTDVAVGSVHVVGLQKDGSLWQWGRLAGVTRSVPTRVGSGLDWLSVSAGSTHSLGIKADGSLWAWGENAKGQLGDGTTTTRALPVQIDGGDWVGVAAGAEHSLAIKADGSLWAWGYNYRGQLGNGTTTDLHAPQRIGGDCDWDHVGAGSKVSIASRRNGSVWTWGENNIVGYGYPLGYDTGGSIRTTPTEVPLAPLVPFAQAATLTVDWARWDATVHSGFIDLAGNPTWLSDGICVDMDPPTTAIEGVPAGWTSGDVAFELSAEDIASGVAKVEYRLDGGQTTRYEGPVTIRKEGLTSIEYWATDMAGRIEAPRVSVARRDSLGLQSVTQNETCIDCHSTYPASHPFDNCSSCHASRPRGHYWDTALAPVGTCDLPCHFQTNQVTPHGAERFSPAGTVWNWTYACERCHSSRYPDVPAHLDADVPHQAAGAVQECRSCHSGVLTREHGRHTDSLGGTFTCLTCHSPGARAGVGAAIAAEDTACEACHPPVGDHGVSHESSPLALQCQSCHSGNLLTEHRENRGLGCDACHSSADSRVIDAIAAADTDCVACHAGDHPHPAASIEGLLANGEKGCTECHSADLVTEHAKPTSRRTGSTCDTCHAEGGPRSLIAGSWDRTCSTPACHAEGSAREVHENYCLACHAASQPDFATSKSDFSPLAAVDRDTACAVCHVPGLVGTHPYHNTGSNCGAACHPGWGNSAMSSTPTYSDPVSGASFASAASKGTPPALLHVIHGTPRWPADANSTVGYYQRNTCGSCHATAACWSCHTDSVPVSHATHSAVGGAGLSARQPWTGRVSHGVVGGDMTQETGSIESNQCASSECHNLEAASARSPRD